MPDPTPDRPPLWRAMHDAFMYTRSGENGRLGFAREIFALRDQIEQLQIENYGVVLPNVREVLYWLTVEALRAEMGDE